MKKFDNLSPQLDHIKNLHPCFFIVFTTFPDFFLDIVQETYNMDHSLAFNQKKSPFRSVCFVIRLLLLYVDASGHEGSNGEGDKGPSTCSSTKVIKLEVRV